MARTNLPEKEELRNLARAGSRGDTQVVHINPQEMDLLSMMGGVGTVNPTTGLRQFYETGSGPGGRDASSDNARDTAGPSQNSSNDGGPAANPESTPERGFFGSLYDSITAIPDRISSFFDSPLDSIAKGLSDPKNQSSVVSALAPTGWGAFAGLMENINNSFFDGQAKSTFADGPFGMSQGTGSVFGGGGISGDKGKGGVTSGAEQGGSGMAATEGRDPYNPGTSAVAKNPTPVNPFAYPDDGDRYTPGAGIPSANTTNRSNFITGLAQVNSPAWRKEHVGFGNGDELLDSIYGPMQNEANEYMGRAQRRGMLDIPSTQVALDELMRQGTAGKAQMGTMLNEQGESILQPLRTRAAELQGQVNSGQYDDQPYTEDLLNQLFSGAFGDVRGRVGELTSDYQPFSPASALYKGLQSGGSTGGSPLLSALANRNRINVGTQRTRGIGSQGVF